MIAEQKQLIELSITAHEQKIEKLKLHIEIFDRLTQTGIMKSIVELDLHFFDENISDKINAGKKITKWDFKFACEQVLETTENVLKHTKELLMEV